MLDLLERTVARVVKAKKPHKPTGFTLWSGPSCTDHKSPLALVVTGVGRPSKNPKTGPMLQTWLIRTDIHPMEASKLGLDKATCNECELSFSNARELRRLGLAEADSPTCYVNLCTVGAVWRTFKDERYPALDPGLYEAVFGGRMVRLGSYGNLSNTPIWVTRAVAEAASGWTMYEHNWRTRRGLQLRPFAMASVSSREAKAEAKALGWRTFRLARDADDILPDEVRCPASREFQGRKRTCAECRLCCGNSLTAKSVVIVDHGPSSPQRKEILQLGRDRLRLAKEEEATHEV